MVEAIPKALELDPQAWRNHAAALFDQEFIARKYLGLSERVLAERKAPIALLGQNNPAARECPGLVVART